MSCEVRIEPGALRGLADLPARIRTQTTRRIDALATAPRPGQSRELSGTLGGLRRIRVGDHRVAYEVEHETRKVTVWAVGHRRDFYEVLTRRFG